jgi:hypothetical protein
MAKGTYQMSAALPEWLQRLMNAGHSLAVAGIPIQKKSNCSKGPLCLSKAEIKTA